MTDKAALPESAKAQTYILFGVAGTTYARAQPAGPAHRDGGADHAGAERGAAVEGVVFSRGQVVPVINLRARFGFNRTAINQRTRLLVVQQGTRNVGLLADEAKEFVTIADASIHPPNEAIGNLSGSYLNGVATLGERVVLILDVREVVESTPIAAA